MKRYEFSKRMLRDIVLALVIAIPLVGLVSYYLSGDDIKSLSGDLIKAVATVIIMAPLALSQNGYSGKCIEIYRDSIKIDIKMEKPNRIRNEILIVVLKWKDIKSITTVKKFGWFHRPIKISTSNKTALIPIKYFRDYKELLNTILEKVEKNESIIIDERVLKIISD